MINRLNKIFTHYNWSQQEASEILGVSKGAISHVLSGRNKPSLDFVISLATAKTELSLDWLLFGRGNMLKSISVPEQKATQPALDAAGIGREIENIEHTLEMINRELVYRLNKIKVEIKKV